MTAFLTGITGLVGCHAAIAMLRSGIRVVAAARRRGPVSAEHRVMKILRAYPGWDDQAGPLSQILTVEGNLLDALCGIESHVLDMLAGSVDVIVHCAGIVSFTSHSDDGTGLRVNTEGVEHVIQLACKLRCKRIIHISTAYVDGSDSLTGYRSDYEETKHTGEKILAEQTRKQGIEAITIRPSIVTGDRSFGFTPTFNGLYPFFRFGAEQWNILQHISPAEWLSPEFYQHATVNLIPAELLGAAIAATAGNWPAAATTFTMVNPQDWPVRDVVHIVAEHLRQRMSNDDAPLQRPRSSYSPEDAGSLFTIYEPYVLAAPRVQKDSEPMPAVAEGMETLDNNPEWIQALLDWGIKVGWKAIA
jgi:thioester reductase-like protein